MKKSLLILFCIIASQPSLSLAEDVKTLKVEAKAHIGQFAMELKGALQGGMKKGGPEHAIDMCNIEAPNITTKHSQGEWTLSRTALKTRNSGNAPTDWQREILLTFEARKAQGETADKLSHSEIRDGRFYFIKAIPTAPLCTVCHGGKVSPQLQSKLFELYPNDKAVGYKSGDIRGAFVVSKAIEEK